MLRRNILFKKRQGLTQGGSAKLTASVTSSLRFILPSLWVSLVGLAIGEFKIITAHAAELRSIIEVQPDTVMSRSTGVEGEYRLILLNKNYKAWYILERNFFGKPETAHLEVTAPEYTQLTLDGSNLVVVGRNGVFNCSLEGDDNQFFREETHAWSATCSPDLYVRHKTAIYASWAEKIADWLRGNRANNPIIEFWVEFGEKTGDSRQIYANRLVGSCGPDQLPASDPKQQIDYFFGTPQAQAAPDPATLTRAAIGQWLLKAEFGLPFEAQGTKLAEKRIGSWVALHDMPGIFASQITPEAAAGAVEISTEDQDKLVYLLGFDLAKFQLNFTLGAAHPAVGPVTGGVRPGKIGLTPGVDGVANSEPLVRAGQVPPWQLNHLAASFNGGFKRAHSALKNSKNQIPAGFVENAIVFSKLQPGFMTLYGLLDGSVDLQIWSDKLANETQGKILFARQNGVAVIENSHPGALIHDEGGGWSGDHDALRPALRSGVCLAHNNSGKFLIYGLFTRATPAEMARVFSAYHCTSAMQLDMTDYQLLDAAVYRWRPEGIEAFSLSKKMRSARKNQRYFGQTDTKDFFWLTRKGDAKNFALSPSLESVVALKTLDQQGQTPPPQPNNTGNNSGNNFKVPTMMVPIPPLNPEGNAQANLGKNSTPQAVQHSTPEPKIDTKSETKPEMKHEAAKHEAANKSSFSFRRAAKSVWRKIESLPKRIWPNSDEAKP